jgi:acetolactate synthase-1/2/3 large subunit
MLACKVPRRGEREAASMATGEISAGLALLARLKRLGVDYLFANAGTDFPPIIEALAAARRHGLELPEALAIPHENAAMGMAHGYYYATGRAQAVMLHTNVGLANGVIGAINAATDNVPILMMSGRTPVTEQDRFGARTVPIGWGQEMRDQTALVREVTKWDYELRFPEQVRSLLDRAHAIAHSTPKGPVYLALPREVLAEACPERPEHVPGHRHGTRRALLQSVSDPLSSEFELLLVEPWIQQDLLDEAHRLAVVPRQRAPRDDERL